MVTAVATVPDDRATVAILGAVLTAMALTVAAVMVVRVHRALRLAEQELETARAVARSAERSAHHAHAEKREAQRILAILSEPLKDWDLADFPGWAETPDRSRGLTERWPLNQEDGEHLWAVVQAYRIVRAEAAHARMSVTAGDKLRGRGWADRPISAPQRAALDPRRLP